jgi:glycosyltransferase involved in cell wall biosynthesis
MPGLPDPLRILLVSNYYPEHVGGIEAVASTLADGYRTHGHEVRWLAGDIRSRPHHEHRDDVPVGVWNAVERLGFPYPLPPPAAVSSISRHVAWSEIVHMHDCLYAANLAAFVAARRRGRPVLLTQHVAKVPYPNALVRGLQSLAYASLGRSVLSRADQVVFVSEVVRRWFEERVRFRRPTMVIENGIDTELFKPVSTKERQAAREALGVNREQPLLLFVGRFVEKKGVRLLRPVIANTSGWSWLLVGRAGDVDPSSWLLPNLKVLAPLPPERLRDIYVAADLLVLPSTGEGFPVVAQEAMACGTPALLSKETAAGMPAVLDHVFTTNPSGEELQPAVELALAAVRADPGLRKRVATFARQRWRAEGFVNRYEQQLEALLR